MKPKEFSWKEDQQVTVKNPTDKDFTFKVHSKDYTVGAGKTVRMPGYIAWMFVYHAACKLAQETNIVLDDNKNKTSDFSRWNEEGFRETYYDKFVVSVEELVQEVFEEPEIEFDEVADPKPVQAPKSTAIQPMRRKRVAKKA